MSLRPRRIDFDSTWETLSETVAGVITLGKVPRSVWNDRFSDVYALCVAVPEPLGDRLYDETKIYLEKYLTILLRKVNESDEDFLSYYYNCWKCYFRGSEYLNRLYMYLNTQHIRKQKCSDADVTYGSFGIDQQEQMLEIGELALNLWKQNMIEPLKDTILQILLTAIKRDRLGQSVNQSVVHGVINSLVTVEEYKKKDCLELYENMFEKHFLQATGDYYRLEASKLLLDNNFSMYMEKVIGRLDSENLRSRRYLHPSSFFKVKKECESRMVADHLKFLHSECKGAIVEEREADLKNLYKLLKPVDNGLDVLKDELQKHIQSIGLNAINNIKGENVPLLYVKSVLMVHSKYLQLINDVFYHDQLFLGALDKACTHVINHRTNPKLPCRSPELLARYCDSLLKKSTKGMTESEIDDKLTLSITVFKYLDDKDVFQKFYAKMLAKRLIHGQSMSRDAEEQMINKLKQACGYEFTSKLHRMFTDMTVSEDLNAKFGKYLNETNVDLGINFSIYVLQAGAWPLGQSNLSPFAIPQQLEKSVHNFEEFYKSKFNGRKLTWIHHLCTAELKLGYLKKPYIMTLGTYQMAVLLSFENSDKYSFNELQESTQLNSEHFSKQLQSLIDSGLILSSSQENPVNSDCIFTLNFNYSNKRTKFKITAAIQKETQQDIEQTNAGVEEDRKLYLQATIVRIMKSRKILKHNALIQEVINQSKSRFAPSVSLIKKCIESLIEKQYLERTPNCSEEYTYVA